MWRRREKTGTALYDESGCNMDMTRRSPGCGSQRLLRCRSHPAGRGPNSSSLFPPLAAVVAVAPKGRGTGVTGRPSFVQPLRHGFAVPPPLVGEALAFRDVFQQTQIGFIENETSLPRAPLLGKTPPAGGGGTQVPKGERLSSECETERFCKS